MEDKSKIRLAIFTARNIKTSTGSTNTVVNLLNNLSEENYEISIITIDDLVPDSMKLSQEELEQKTLNTPYSLISESKKVSRFYNLGELNFSFIKEKFDVAIVAIYNTFGEDGKLLGVLDTCGVSYICPPLKTSLYALTNK